MEKNYKSLNELIKKSNLIDAFKYKYLEMRDRHPVVNKICSFGFLSTSGFMSRCESSNFHVAFGSDYVAYWYNSKLIHFIPDPKYPDDAHNTLKLEDLL